MAMCRVERLPQSCEGAAPQPEASQQQPALLALDGNALANLEVSANSAGCKCGQGVVVQLLTGSS